MLRAEAHHRSTGGARLVLRNESNVPVAELVLDSTALAIEALEALAFAMGGSLQYGVLLTSPSGTEHVIAHHSVSAAERDAEDSTKSRQAAVVRRAFGPWLTEEERKQ